MLRARMGSKWTYVVSRRLRGSRRAVIFFAAALAILASGCGRSGHGAATDSEKAADVDLLNAALAQELTTVAAYERGLAQLRGPMLVVGREFRGQDQAHVDALTKAIRGLGGEVEAEASELEGPGPQSREDALVLAYEEENAALAQALDAVPRLQTPAPRALAAALAASHAQHLAILRQGLGESLATAVPEAFESAEQPADGPKSRDIDRFQARRPSERG